MKLKGSIVIGFSGNRHLMVRHSQRSWEFPGGHIEGAEAPLDAAIREFREETGLEGRNWKDCGVAELDNGNLALFSCQVRGRPAPMTNEIVESRFFTALPHELSFARPEYFQLLEMAGRRGKRKTDYDIASKDFDNVRTTKPSYLEGWSSSLMKWGRIESAKQVLDLGCGTGRYSVELAERTGAKVTGLDFSRGMLEKACQKKQGIWLQGDACHLPFESGTFDAVIIMLVLQHLDDEPAALCEAFRALRPGGRLVIGTVSHARIKRHVMRHFPGLVRIDLDRFMPVPELKWHLRNIGFKGVRHHPVASPTEEVAVDALLDRFRRRYISTLALVPERDFGKNMAVFEQRLRSLYDGTVGMNVEITFVEAIRP